MAKVQHDNNLIRREEHHISCIVLSFLILHPLTQRKKKMIPVEPKKKTS